MEVVAAPVHHPVVEDILVEEVSRMRTIHRNGKALTLSQQFLLQRLHLLLLALVEAATTTIPHQVPSVAVTTITHLQAETLLDQVELVESATTTRAQVIRTTTHHAQCAESPFRGTRPAAPRRHAGAANSPGAAHAIWAALAAIMPVALQPHRARGPT